MPAHAHVHVYVYARVCARACLSARARVHARAFPNTFRHSAGESARCGCMGMGSVCGRFLGMEEIPGSDGRCGPNNGPECSSCRRFRVSMMDLCNDHGAALRLGRNGEFYCGAALLFTTVGSVSAGCGDDGFQCHSCRRFQTEAREDHELTYAVKSERLIDMLLMNQQMGN